MPWVPDRKAGWPRRGAIRAAGALGAVLLAAAWAVPPMLEWNHYRHAIAAFISAEFGRQIVIAGDVALQLLPRPVLTASGVTVPDAGDGVSASIANVRLEVAFLPLLSGRLVVRDVVLGRPVVQLPWPLPPGFMQPERPTLPHAFAAHVENGTLLTGHTIIGGINAAIHGGPEHGPAQTIPAASFGAEGFAAIGGQRWRFTAALGAPDADNVAPLDLSLQGEGRAGNTSAVLVATVDNGLLQGRVKAAGDDLSLLLPAARLPWHLDAPFTATGEKLESPALALSLDGSPATASFSLQLAPPAHAQAAIHVAALDLDSLMRVLPGPAVWPALPVPARIDVNADSATLLGGHLTHLMGTFGLAPGLLTLDAVQAGLPGADLALSGTMRTGAAGHPEFSGAVTLDSPDLRTTLAWLRPVSFGLFDRLPRRVLRVARLSAGARLVAFGNGATLALPHLDGTLDGAAIAGSLDLRLARHPTLTGDLQTSFLSFDDWLEQAPPDRAAALPPSATMPAPAIDRTNPDTDEGAGLHGAAGAPKAPAVAGGPALHAAAQMPPPAGAPGSIPAAGKAAAGQTVAQSEAPATARTTAGSLANAQPGPAGHATPTPFQPLAGSAAQPLTEVSGKPAGPAASGSPAAMYAPATSILPPLALPAVLPPSAAQAPPGERQIAPAAAAPRPPSLPAAETFTAPPADLRVSRSLRALGGAFGTFTANLALSADTAVLDGIFLNNLHMAGAAGPSGISVNTASAQMGDAVLSLSGGVRPDGEITAGRFKAMLPAAMLRAWPPGLARPAGQDATHAQELIAPRLAPPEAQGAPPAALPWIASGVAWLEQGLAWLPTDRSRLAGPDPAPLSFKMTASGPPDALDLEMHIAEGDLVVEAESRRNTLTGEADNTVTLRHPGAPFLLAAWGWPHAETWLGEGPLTLLAHAHSGRGALTIGDATLTAANLHLTGSGALGRDGDLALHLQSDALPLPPLDGSALARLPLAPLTSGWTGTITLAATSVSSGGRQLADRLAASLTTASRNAVFNAEATGGALASLRGEAAIDGTQQPAHAAAGVAVTRLSAADMLPFLPIPATGGSVDLSLHTDGAGETATDMLRAQHGEAIIMLRHVSVAGFDLARAGRLAAAAAPRASLADALTTGVTNDLSGTVQGRIEGPSFVLDDAVLSSIDGVLHIRGANDFVAGTLDTVISVAPAAAPGASLTVHLDGSPGRLKSSADFGRFGEASPPVAHKAPRR